MHPLLAVAVLVVGFVLLIKGADWLVDGASSIALRFGMSDLMIGLTIVSFGTSMPELIVNIFASFQGSSDIAFGNILGSNIANTFLVLGGSAALAPLFVQSSTVRKEIPFCLLASVLLLVVVNSARIDGGGILQMLTRSEGVVLMLFFLIFLFYTFSLRRDLPGDDIVIHHRHPLIALLLVFLGCCLLFVGGKFVVDSATVLARAAGISDALIGLTIVAVGTSLPELVTSCVAAYRGKLDIAVGNVVGSNIFNILWILGISAIIRPLPFNPAMNVDLLVVILSSLFLFFLVHRGPLHHRLFLFWHPKMREQYDLKRMEGGLLLIIYAAYVAYIAMRG